MLCYRTSPIEGHIDRSARCTQVEAFLSCNLRVSAIRVKLTDLDMHTLTRESQEVMVGVIVVSQYLHVVVVDP